MKAEDLPLFRASSLGVLMASPKGTIKKQWTLNGFSIAAKEVPFLIKTGQTQGLEYHEKKIEGEGLTDGAKKLIKDVWREKNFGYRKKVITKEMLKGHLCEQESRKLIQKVLGGPRRNRNTKRRSNKWITGMHDIHIKKPEEIVEDIKNSWDFESFDESKLNPLYEWQGRAYMWLLKAPKFRLVYTVNPTPEHLLTPEKMKYYYMFDSDETNEDYMEIISQIEHNNEVIKRLPEYMRVKTFTIERDESKEEEIREKVELAWEYYKTLELKPHHN